MGKTLILLRVFVSDYGDSLADGDSELYELIRYVKTVEGRLETPAARAGIVPPVVQILDQGGFIRRPLYPTLSGITIRYSDRWSAEGTLADRSNKRIEAKHYCSSMRPKWDST